MAAPARPGGGPTVVFSHGDRSEPFEGQREPTWLAALASHVEASAVVCSGFGHFATALGDQAEDAVAVRRRVVVLGGTRDV